MNSLDNLKAMLQKESGQTAPHFDVAGEVVTASKTCSVTGAQYIVRVPLQDYESWRNGWLAQRAFPYLNADDREFLISGTTPAEFEALFGSEE